MCSHSGIVVEAAVAVSWLGEFVHNVADMPDLALLSPENVIPALIAAGLFLSCWLLPSRRAPPVLLLVWGALNLVGGEMTVIPFGFLPFYPEQTLKHYLFHVLYAAAQLPPIYVATPGPRLRASPR